MANNYGKYSPGQSPQKAGFRFETGAPLDDRTVVKNKKSLISQTAFTKLTWVFPGMMTVDKETGKLYILKDAENLELLTDEQLDNLSTTEVDKKVDKYWVLASADMTAVNDLINEKVATLFQFKGVATAIDPDHTTLTIGAATVSGSIGVAPNIKQFENKPLISYGTVLQENLDSVKYAWGTSEYPNLFFTDKLYTTKDEGQTQYKKGAEEDLQYINIFDTLYFYKPNQDKTVNYTIPSQVSGGSPTTGTRTYKVWEALDNGGTLYSLPSEKVNKTLDVYTVTSTAELPTALKTGVSVSTYKYYQFTEIADASKYTVKINTSVNAVTSVTASSANNGHVYQIGEEEYASNGNMWVQLGSPKTDWIVL